MTTTTTTTTTTTRARRSGAATASIPTLFGYRNVGVVALLAVVVLLATGACSSEPPVADGAPPAAVVEAPITYVAIGGRETVNRGLGDGFRRSWTGQLFATLPRSTVFANLAADGTKVSAALADQVPKAIELKPTVVTVWFSSDDRDTPPASYVRDLTQVATQLKASGARVLLLQRPDGGGGVFAASTEAVAHATGTEYVVLPAAATQEQRRDPAAQTAIADALAPHLAR